MVRILKGLLLIIAFQLAHAVDLPADYKGHIFLYSHGLADTSSQVEKYVKAGIITEPYVTFNYKDSVEFESEAEQNRASGRFITLLGDIFKKRRIRFTHAALGQKYDIDQLKDQYDKIRKSWPEAKIILFGVSRGSATIDGLLDLYPECTDHLAAVITESEFGSMPAVVDHLMKQYKLLRLMPKETAYRNVESFFRQYKHVEPSPQQHLENAITKNPDLLQIPRLIICAETDHLVPIQSTLKLYTTLKNFGHDKAHVITLAQGRHGFLIEGPCREDYRRQALDFLSKYKLLPDDVTQ